MNRSFPDPGESQPPREPSPPPRPPAGRQWICVKSRPQAEEWSLVLASQGIYPAIFQEPESGEWKLEITQPETRRAARSLRRYLQENRRWSPVAEPPMTDRIWHPAALVWCLYLVLVHVVNLWHGGALRDAGLMANAAVANGEWWRLITAVSLHGDAGHLVSNLVAGTLLLGLVMERDGVGIALLAGWLAGLCGNLLGWMLYAPDHRSLGASGMVLGLLGLLSIQGVLGSWHLMRHCRALLSGLGGGILIFVLIGLNPASDILAHLGGFLAGILFGAVLNIPDISNRTVTRPADFIGITVVLATVVTSWWLALW